MSSPRPETISISDEISSPVIASLQHRVLGGSVAQLLEARHEVERLRVEHRELLLEAHGEVRGRREDLLRAVEVDGHAVTCARGRQRRDYVR